jgi:signal transduction histidine kinase
MTTLRAVIAYLASTVRFAGCVYTVVQVVFWHSFYAGAPWDLAAPAVAVCWGAVMAFYLRRGWPSPFLACADSAVYVVLGVAAAGCVAPDARDVALSWLVISMSSQLMVASWYAPGALPVVLALISPAAYCTGALMQPAPDVRTLTGTAVLLLIIGLGHAYGRRTLYARAEAADAGLAWADQAASEQFAFMSATIERREHERLLHDTVLNTLTALARAGGDDETGVVNRCRQDVALIEDALGDPGDPGELAWGTRRPSGDLLAELGVVVTDMRARGLAVHLESGDGNVPAVPARVAVALSNAVREALSNVAAHAGTGEAWLRVRSMAPAQDAGAPRRLEVFVRDHGTGFDLARVDPARLGLRRSIEERIAECGGQASVWSVPGQGTAVRLSWPASDPPGDPRRAGELGPVSRARAHRGRAQESLPW